MFERCDMRCRVDAAGEAGGNDETFQRKLGRDLAREFLSNRRAVASADNGDNGDIGELQPALGVEQGRRGVDLGKGGGIAGLTDGNQGGAKPIRRLEFGLGFSLGAKADVGASSAPRQQRQRLDGGFGATELIDQTAEGGGADISRCGSA
jgi:hypothetical protein